MKTDSSDSRNINISMDEFGLEIMAYNVIRREVSSIVSSGITRETRDAELGNFVKGVVALQRDISMMADIEYNNKLLNTPRSNNKEG